MKQERRLENKRHIRLLRCSSAGQAETSIDDQRRLLDHYAQEQGMIFVDEVVLSGVSGSTPGNRSDIPALVARKQQQNDFDVLLVQDTSRLTRSGVRHAHHIEYELNCAGIDLVFATGSISDDWVGDIQKTVLATTDQRHAQSISFTSARGSMSSILDDRSPYCRRPPYAIDRLYVSPEGTQLHILRNRADGTQEMLDVQTKEVTRTFGRNEKTGAPNHYLKQKQERIVLVPGDPRCVAILRRIYRRALVDNWGAFRIAAELNSDGVASPSGRKWTTYTIGSILKNPIYTGRGIANRYSAAIYHMRGAAHPVEVDLPKQERYGRRRPSTRIRPESDWHIQEHPQLVELLDSELRELAIAKQQKHLDRQASGRKGNPNRDRHRDSSYFLKDLLRSAQGDLPMTGRTTGKKGKRKRYYTVSRAFNAPDENRIMRRLIPAEPLEQIVLELVRLALLQTPDLRERVEHRVRVHTDQCYQDHAQLQDLLKQRETLGKRLEWVIDNFDPELKEVADRKIAELQGQLRSVKQRIAVCEQAVPMSEDAIAESVEEVQDFIEGLAEKLADAPPATLREYLRLLIGKLVVDLETREVVLQVRLPDFLEPQELRVCLDEGFACKTYNQAHPDFGPVVTVYRLIWDQKAYLFCLQAQDSSTMDAA
jgi:hypothetical protein